jgi:hypothetical protein
MSELPVDTTNDSKLSTLIETTEQSSLVCTYDEETRQIQFEWDESKNPEYNYLLSMTSEDLIEKIIRWSTSEDAAVNTEAE